MNLRKERYRKFLIYSLICSCATLMVVSYLYCYSLVPSNIKIRAGMEQTIEFGIPVTGEFRKMENEPEAVAVSEQGESNVPKSAITMEMQDAVTLYAAKEDSYHLQLKLFGLIPLKEVEVEVIEDRSLIPAGIPIGIYVKTDGVLVVGVGEFKSETGVSSAPSKYLLKVGDYITKVNGEPVEGKADFMETVAASQGAELVLTVKRGSDIFEVKTQPELNESGEYKLGIWIRDNAQGIGTLTFVDGDGEFGALGHGINDVDTSELLVLDGGTLYHTEIVAIRKGMSGVPGEMTGMIEYTNDNILGEVTVNSVEGIYGIGNEKLLEELEQASIPIALKQEIKTGDAQILCTVAGCAEWYDIEITDLNMDADEKNRGISLQITDEELLATTGGIVQGMSGAPIIQNGRIVGAVTHVLVQDATRGYGIFIEEMIQH